MEGQLSLTELNSLIRETLQVTFPEQIWVVAEISELKVNRNGHCYLELVEKENEEITARARATIWSWQFRFIQPYFETTTGQALTAGIRVLVSVSVEFHEVYGYSLNIKDIDPSYTLGDMARKRTEIIRRLTDEGIIDMNKEIPFPDVPLRIAVISSPTAAGYEDFMNQLDNNQSGYCFYTKLFPATMQGNDSANSIMSALDFIYEFEDLFDIVVIIRGGGSQLDLACFDDYNLASHIAQFPLPVLTGIGHEKDDTITDQVAHTRLKTPTAVAEFLIGKYDEAASEIEELESAFFGYVNEKLNEEKQRINHAARLLKPLVSSTMEKNRKQLSLLHAETKSLAREEMQQQQFRLTQMTDLLKSGCHSLFRIKNKEFRSTAQNANYKIKSEFNSEIQKLSSSQNRLQISTRQLIDKQKDQLRLYDKTRQLVDPKSILDRGFSITLKNGKAVKDSDELEEGEQMETIFAHGKTKSIVKNQS
ncbi:MAG TPA: exodeoxyribonuclease VII large subunit [Prolixibacteraceae bacterium]|nr:exodeoxyribonuclease VII large subunit [Prolixibacteraceae bacterium]